LKQGAPKFYIALSAAFVQDGICYNLSSFQTPADAKKTKKLGKHGRLAGNAFIFKRPSIHECIYQAGGILVIFPLFIYSSLIIYLIHFLFFFANRFFIHFFKKKFTL